MLQNINNKLSASFANDEFHKLSSTFFEKQEVNLDKDNNSVTQEQLFKEEQAVNIVIQLGQYLL